jgi:hypothetical protein
MIIGGPAFLPSQRAAGIPALTKNRTSAVDLRCVWARSGEQLDFNETESAELSTINPHSPTWACTRAADRRARVTRLKRFRLAICWLITLLHTKLTTFRSILKEILSRFDYSSYDIRLITVEQAYSNLRKEQIFGLLMSHSSKSFPILTIGMSGQRRCPSYKIRF